MDRVDVIVIGAGHAGCEAALASARMGISTLLLTMNNDRIAYMSCNPAIGGQAKGQLAREVDALGGEMGINTDKSALQYKRLNMSKGPAVRSSRAQCDKVIYSLRMKESVETQENLSVAQREVRGFQVEQNKITGVFTNFDELIRCDSVIVTAGTFMKSLMFCGSTVEEGGRAGDTSANKISTCLKDLGFELIRLKTGTPARLKKNSIDFTRLQREDGDKFPVPFSYFSHSNPFPVLTQLPCFLTYTNTRTHEIIANAKDRSPMFNGSIGGRGPRYCPSIEDKVYRFFDKERHQIFLEPESQFSHEIYANGLSTSLPLDVQKKFLSSIEGLEKVEISRPGYAVEYDAVNPLQLKLTLESKNIEGLFFAGQVNGTSGYEEAAAQGLIAGINAALKTKEKDPFIVSRSDAYIGVLIDDLVTKGVDEPYRMFTSRCEHRLLLREDNGDHRLVEKGRSIGLLNTDKYSYYLKKLNWQQNLTSSVKFNFLYPKEIEMNKERYEALGLGSVKDKLSFLDLLKRPEWSLERLEEEKFIEIPSDGLSEIEKRIWSENVEVSAKYSGYIDKELELLKKVRDREGLSIPKEFSYKSVSGLSNEVRERLERVSPSTLGQAMRIHGITPAATALLYIHLEKYSNEQRTL